MKIIEVVFSLSPGGAERFVVDLSNEFVNQGHEVTLLTLKDDKKDTERRQFYRFDLSDKVEYRNLGLKDGFKIKSPFVIYKALKHIKPDIVHINGRNCSKFCILAILMLLKDVRFYVTIHNDMNRYGNLFYRLLFNTLGRWNLMHFVAISGTNFQDLTKMHPYVDAHCIVNGRAPIKPSELFEEVKKEVDTYKHDSNTKIILHVARLSPQKNQQLLIDAFRRLEQLKVNAVLLIIGDGFDSAEGKSLLEKGGKNIHYLGVRKNIGDYHLCSDIFTLSSMFEGMPITLLEASLVGIPAVCTPVCGAVDIIENGKNGYISKDFTLDEYVTALCMAIDNNEQQKKNAKEMSFKSPYTIHECANRYSSLFQAKY